MGATSSKREDTIEKLYTSTSAFNTFSVETIRKDNWKQSIPEFIQKVVTEYRTYFIPSLAFLRKNSDIQKEQEYTQRLFVDPLSLLYRQMRELAALSRNYPTAFQTQINDFYFDYYKRQTLSYVMLYEREKIYLALAHILQLKFFDVLTKLTNINASTMKVDVDKTITAYKDGLSKLIIAQMQPITNSLGSFHTNSVTKASTEMGKNIQDFDRMKNTLNTFFGVTAGGGTAPEGMAPAHGTIQVMGTTDFPPKVKTADIRDVLFASFHKQIETSIKTLSTKSAAFYNACVTLYKQSVEYVANIIRNVTAMLVMLQDRINKKVDEAKKALDKVTTEIQRINAQFYKEVVVSDLKNVDTLKTLLDTKVAEGLKKLQEKIDAVETPPPGP